MREHLQISDRTVRDAIRIALAASGTLREIDGVVRLTRLTTGGWDVTVDRRDAKQAGFIARARFARAMDEWITTGGIQ